MQRFTPLEYLAIDIASNFGLDKDTWDNRIQWFMDNIHNLTELIPKAENPALYHAGLRAYSKYLNNEPSGYPISLDATASGLQILACVTNDINAAKLCNVIDIGNREDAYTNVYNIMGSGTITRKDVKSALMTALYGSTKEPKQVFGNGDLLKKFYSVIQKEMPLCWMLTHFMLNSWNSSTLEHSWIMPDNFNVKVEVMDTITTEVEFGGITHYVPQRVNKPVEMSKSNAANITHSIDGFIVRELNRRCNYSNSKIDYVKQLLAGKVTHKSPVNRSNLRMIKKLNTLNLTSGIFTLRTVDYLDTNTINLVDKTELIALLNSLPTKPFEVLSVHDCFRVLPNYGNDLRQQYNNILSELADSQLIKCILDQVYGYDFIDDRVIDKQFVQDIKNTNYALS